MSNRLEWKGGRLSFQRYIPFLALLSGLPAIVIALVLIWSGDLAGRVQVTLTVLILVTWAGLLATLRDRLVRPLHVVSNLLSAMREGDYSLRTRGSRPDDALGLILTEVNALGQSFHDQRLGALEAENLLERLLTVIDVALFAFDDRDQLILVNPAGERVLGQAKADLEGRHAEDLRLADCLVGDTPRIMELAFAEGLLRYELRRRSFRQNGRRHRLVVLADLSKILREEERIAWQRLIRVLSHEINNSLTPIKSIADSLDGMLDRMPTDAPLREDLQEGLKVIAGRSAALGRFMSAYARLAKLPRPVLAEVDVDAWVRRVADLETRGSITVESGPAVTIDADGDQLDQLLINLLDNALDAAEVTDGSVSVSWRADSHQVEVNVKDTGPGLAETANLFVPFYTTKPEGSGVGLALSRLIAEAHGGVLSLANRKDGPGCVARVRLPVSPMAASAPE
ncbi:MAG: ATP-binding protein [Gemmatimonadota bacterium]